MYRQGDVAIIPVEMFKALNPDFNIEKAQKVERDKGRVILAYGEVTGHAHALSAPEVDMYTLVGLEDDGALGNDNDRLLVCLEEVALEHEEHDTIRLPAGSFIVKRQRQYFPDQIRTVAD